MTKRFRVRLLPKAKAELEIVTGGDVANDKAHSRHRAPHECRAMRDRMIAGPDEGHALVCEVA
jgi:hypothetical protein